MGKIEKKVEDGKTIYSILIDNTKLYGILRSTHELQLEFTVDAEGNAKIHSGWEFNCGGDWTWETGEEDIMEQTHPGLLKKLADEVRLLKEVA